MHTTANDLGDEAAAIERQASSLASPRISYGNCCSSMRIYDQYDKNFLTEGDEASIIPACVIATACISIEIPDEADKTDLCDYRL